eukprot:gene49098-7638_t
MPPRRKLPTAVATAATGGQRPTCALPPGWAVNSVTLRSEPGTIPPIPPIDETYRDDDPEPRVRALDK